MMLLSVLIPVFNWDIRMLVAELSEQILGLGEGLNRSIEVLVVDDGSTDRAIRDLNRSTFDSPKFGVRRAWCRYLENEVNVGRSMTRNRLVRESKGLNLLFLDADVLPDGEGFIESYVDIINKRMENFICCGGISYKRCNKQVEKEREFYLWYSSRVSVRPAMIRQMVPWAWVFTANVLISRELAIMHGFDPNFSAYGYEDIEWGIRLHKVTEILHLDNSVSHMGLLSKEVLLKKTKASAVNLLRLSCLHPNEARAIRVFRYAQFISCFPRASLIALSWFITAVFLRCNFNNYIMYILYQVDKMLSVGIAIKVQSQSAAKR